jgi:hypothetical protein
MSAIARSIHHVIEAVGVERRALEGVLASLQDAARRLEVLDPSLADLRRVARTEKGRSTRCKQLVDHFSGENRPQTVRELSEATSISKVTVAAVLQSHPNLFERQPIPGFVRRATWRLRSEGAQRPTGRPTS